MKYLKLLFVLSIISLFGITLQARQLTIQSSEEHSGNSAQQFPLDDGLLDIDRGYYSIEEEGILNPESWSISYGGKKVSFLENRDGSVFYSTILSSGEKSAEANLEFFDTQDETMKVYAFDDGRAVTRDNVANFTFYAPDGDVLFSQSNSSQSTDGERESQLASDAEGQTVVLYNPIISFGNTRGSQARVIFNENDSDRFFNSQSTEIKDLKVSENGSFITILTSDNDVYLFDRFGNELNQLSFDDNQIGLNLSEDAEFLTVYSSGRVQVLNALSGERLGSTSSRSPVIYATYQPEDDTILIFGGDIQGDQIDDPMITAVSISQRQILREEINMPIALHDLKKLRVTRTGSNQFRINGLNRSLLVQASF